MDVRNIPMSESEKALVVEVLDGEIHDLKSLEATKINNGGLDSQIEYLIGELGEDRTRNLILDALEVTRG